MVDRPKWISVLAPDKMVTNSDIMRGSNDSQPTANVFVI